MCAFVCAVKEQAGEAGRGRSLKKKWLSAGLIKCGLDPFCRSVLTCIPQQMSVRSRQNDLRNDSVDSKCVPMLHFTFSAFSPSIDVQFT